MKGIYAHPESTLPILDIENYSASLLEFDTTAADVDDLPEGVYAIWTDVDAYIKVHPTNAADVTAANGFFVNGGDPPILVFIRQNSHLGGIAGAACDLKYHKVG